MNYSKNIFALTVAVCMVTPSVIFAAKPAVAMQKTTNDPVVEINFADLQLSEFVKMVAKITGKNILLSVDVPGKVDFISQKSIRQSELFDLLINVLETKGFTIVDSQKGYLKVVPSSEASKNNLPVNVETTKIPQMMNKVFQLNTLKANDAMNAIKHLLSKNGTIVVSPDSNNIVVSDYPSNIATIGKVVMTLDKDGNKISKFVVLQNTKAPLVYENLQKMAGALFASQKVEVLKDDGTNTIIILGSKENVAKFLPLVEKMDQKDEFGTRQQTNVIALKNAEAENLVKILNEIFSKKFYPKDFPRPLISADSQLNALIVVSSLDELNEIKNVVKELDLERQQVYVKAKIVEISDNKSAKIGAKYGIEGGVANSSGLFTLAANLGGGTSIAISDTILGYIAKPTIKEGLALGASLSLLNSEGAANLLSEPSILCINNQESTIYVGRTEPIITGSTIGATTTDLTKNSYTRQDIGLTLKVKPRLSTDNKVTLYVEAKLEDILAGSTVGLPQTTKREVKTVAIVSNGENVIIGGLIRDNMSDKVDKVPLLGDVPLFGRLFRYKEDAQDKINLVILLTPYIVDKSSDLTTLRARLHELDKIQNDYVKQMLEKNK